MSNSIKQNYKKPERVDRRLRYMSGWKLLAQDFIDEQNYHVVRKWSHNRWLHTPGICEGLAVSVENGQLKVSAGTAVDGKGKQIVLVEKTDPSLDLKLKSHKGKKVLLHVYYHEEDEPAPYDEPESAPKGNKRWYERPRFGIADQDNLTENQVALAGLVIDEEGDVKGEPVTSVRQYAGVRLPGGKAARKEVTMRSTDAGKAEFDGDLRVTKDLKVDGKVVGALCVSKDLKVDGKVGIGVPRLSAELDVNGTVNATNFTGDGSELKVSNRLSIKEALEQKAASCGAIHQDFKAKKLTVGDSLIFGSASGRWIIWAGAIDYNGEDALVFRSKGKFAWYKAPFSNDAEPDPSNPGTVQMVIEDGNVGIGTGNETPKKKLDVRGDVNIVGNIHVNNNKLSNYKGFPTADLIETRYNVEVNKEYVFTHEFKIEPSLIQVWVLSNRAPLGPGVPPAEVDNWKMAGVLSVWEEGKSYGTIVEKIGSNEIVIRTGTGGIYHGAREGNYFKYGKVRVMAWW